jgi:hypothetical protein
MPSTVDVTSLLQAEQDGLNVDGILAVANTRGDYIVDSLTPTNSYSDWTLILAELKTLVLTVSTPNSARRGSPTQGRVEAFLHVRKQNKRQQKHRRGKIPS